MSSSRAEGWRSPEGKCVTLIELCKALNAEGHFRSDLQCQALRHPSLHTGGDRVRALIVTHGRRSGIMTDPQVARDGAVEAFEFSTAEPDKKGF